MRLLRDIVYGIAVIVLIDHVSGRQSREVINTMSASYANTIKAVIGPTDEDLFEQSIAALSHADRLLLRREWKRARETS